MTIRINWILFLIVFFQLAFVACNNDDDETDLVGNWVKLGTFDGYPRSDAVAFVIGSKAYMGTGYYGSEDERFNDFWQYDSDKDLWTQLADFSGEARNGAVGFSAAGKGYIGTGYNGEDKLNDFHEYNPETNTWREVASFGGTARYGAVAFSFNNLGYVGTGYDGNVLKDFWRYDPTNDSWTQIASIGGSKRRDAAVFIVDGKAFVCMGMDNGNYVKDFWAFDPSNESWIEKRKIANASDESYDDDYEMVGSNAVAFNIGSLGYVTTGGAGSPGTRTWEYNPISDLWDEKSTFEGNARFDAIAFTVNNKPIVAAGRSSGYYFDDVWTFNPADEQDDDD